MQLPARADKWGQAWRAWEQAQVDYLIESLLAPNAKVKENFNAVVVATSDGRVITGVKLRQNGSELVLRDSEDREIAVPAGSIEEQKDVGSLMPVGLVESLTRQEFLDLVRFLSELGKVGPFAVGQSRVVRSWRTINPTQEVIAEVARSGVDAAPATPNLVWQPLYSTVAGTLPLLDVPTIRQDPAKSAKGWLRFALDVSNPGKIRLRFNSTAGLSVWFDGKPVDLQDQIDLETSTGRHEATLAVEPGVRKEDLRIELLDVPGSTARVRIATGK